LSIRPCHGTCWAPRKHPDRLPATYHRTHGIRYFHGCYDLSRDRLWGITRLHKGGKYTLAALKSIRAARPDNKPIYVILDNLSANKTPAIRAWAARHHVELCLTPTNASWADPIEAQFGPLRGFVIGTPTTPTTSSWPAPSRPSCAGATPTTATPSSSRRNAANVPGSAANATNAGADHDHRLVPDPDPAHSPGQRTSAVTIRDADMLES
jgi:DDE superfamily endonuclease